MVSTSDKTRTEILKLTRRSKNRWDWWKIPYKSISKIYTNPCSSGRKSRNACSLPRGKIFKIAILAVPCHGFGDVIFASKLANYVNDWYRNASVTIYTTNKKGFLTLGLTGIKIVALSGERGDQCRRLKRLKAEKRLVKPDLILVAPLIADFDIDYNDVKALFKNSTPFNTMFFSEYQDSLRKGHDFPTGIGPRRLGLLFDDVKATKRVVKGPYVLTYIAKDVGPVGCFYTFIGMIAKKYHKKYPRLQIVLPKWLAIEASTKKLNLLKRHLGKRYSILEVRTPQKKDTYSLSGGKGKVLILRGDVLPVPRPEMISLMKHSLPDISVTGDQSLTDALGCCSNKNIFYQTAGWKRALLKSLYEEIPKGPYKTMAEACGNLRYIKWKGEYRKFLKRNDFRVKGKHQLDAVVRSIVEYKNPKSFIRRYIEAVKSSHTKQSLLLKLN